MSAAEVMVRYHSNMFASNNYAVMFQAKYNAIDQVDMSKAAAINDEIDAGIASRLRALNLVAARRSSVKFRT